MKFFIFILFCLHFQWGLLLRDYNEAKDLIEDIREICDDFEGLCQRNLAANTGLLQHIDHINLFWIKL